MMLCARSCSSSSSRWLSSLVVSTSSSSLPFSSNNSTSSRSVLASLATSSRTSASSTSASILPHEEVGPGGGGTSQQQAQQMLARLPGYDPEWHAEPVTVVTKHGMSLLLDPWLNKGTGFPAAERERLGLNGLLPPRVVPMHVQEERFLAAYHNGNDLIPPEEATAGSVTNEMARQWMELSQLQNRNETLFYAILQKHFESMCSIIYTPTVGWACSNYHRIYRRPRGMFFSANDKGEMAAMVHNWPQDDVQAIVVTDGSRILGLGDLGVNGLGIAIGKLDLYVAAAGFHPSKVLPCVVDVGTDNQALRSDPLYCGLNMPRLTGRAYYEVMDEFVRAVMARWPDAVLQFEDFSMSVAKVLLERYKRHHLAFNDDVQGTAATAVAGLFGALRVLGKPRAAITEQRVVCVGAGSAGMGVVSMIAAAMEKQGASPEAAAGQFWVLDKEGLISQARQGLPDYVQRFARPLASGAGGVVGEGAALLEVVRQVKPTVLLGLSGAGRLFTADVLQAVAAAVERPVIFAMSNPNSKMEATAAEAHASAPGCVYASGSPQMPLEIDGVLHPVSQCNNMYLFPGLARGAWLGRTGNVTDSMLMAAAEAVPTLIAEADVRAGLPYPRLKDIRHISCIVAREVIKAAAADGHVGCPQALEALAKGDDALLHWVSTHQMFTPAYASLAYCPPDAASSRALQA